MCDIDEINPHLGLAISESYISTGERAWLAWAAKAEKLLGHDLDGNEDRDGYSMDGAYGSFEAGVTAKAYVALVREAALTLAPIGA